MNTAKRIIYTVSQLNQASRLALENQFPSVWVEGEVSNLAQPASGHIYFTLKDAQAQIRCVMFRSQVNMLSHPIAAGNQVLVRAKVSLYQTRGDFQLIVDYCEPAGEGALRRAYEILKQKLDKEGLFDPAHKQAIPELPQTIGVITSPTGAVIRDILTTLKRRFPAIAVIIYPCEVQGKQAASAIIRSLEIASQRQECEVLILARGGGSLEDLWPFNEEALARALFASKIPVVSGIGHEVDTTIADFVADQRAATPTAAAELTSPDQQDYLQNYVARQVQITKAMLTHLKNCRRELKHLLPRLQHPRTYLRETAQTLDYYHQQLVRACKHFMQTKRNQAGMVTTKIYQHNPRRQISTQQQTLHWLQQSLAKAMHNYLHLMSQQIRYKATALETMSPLATLARGYAIVTNEKNELIRTGNQLQKDEIIQVRLHKGQVACKVESIKS